MEFEEIKKIWDTQNKEPIYGINETALHNRILLKQKQAYHITNISELLGILAYGISGICMLAVNFYKQGTNIFMYILSAWMLASALYALVSRIRRVNADRRFDRSLRGDLAQAISVATYQVNLSRLMRWNVLPIAVLVILAIWGGEKSVWIAVGILVFFILTLYASGWEHGIYRRRKRELEILQQNLENEETVDLSS